MWLLPTLNRIEKLKKCLESIERTKTTQPGLILIDKNDFKANEAAYRAISPPERWSINITNGVTMGDKCREIVPTLTGDWVGILNDDHEMITEGWDVKLTSRLDGKNFVSANDRWMAPIKATTATAWSKPLLEAVGWPIFPPGLQHLFIDDVWECLGKNTGCWRVCMDVVVEHHHVLKIGGADSTHEKVYNKRAWDTDKATFDLFIQHDLKATVEAIVALQDCIPSQRYNPSPNRDERPIL